MKNMKKNSKIEKEKKIDRTNKKIDNKKKLIILFSLLGILILSYLWILLFSIKDLDKYDDKVFPNIYIEDLDMSNCSYKNAIERLKYYDDYILSKKIKVNANSKDYEFTLNDLGISIDKTKTIEKIKEYQKKLGYSKKIKMANGSIKRIFTLSYNVDNNKLRDALNNLKGNVDTEAINGYFDTSEGVRYVAGVNGYSLNVDNSINVIDKVFSEEINYEKVIPLEGEVLAAAGNDSYKNIDTMTSAFETWFMPNTYLRNINLNTALSYINGTVVEPGEVFSYCDKAGPFNKYGYVFYYEFVGNGVCQIATTTYNAALLGGLEIVKRYPHDKKSLYVDGGLDATVASYSSGWCVDMQFKNTYEYPIYIKAYSYGGKARVEFWSNSQAKKGLEYTTSSVQIGHRGYRSYLHTWKDGQEIDVHEIETTWYLKD